MIARLVKICFSLNNTVRFASYSLWSSRKLFESWITFAFFQSRSSKNNHWHFPSAACTRPTVDTGHCMGNFLHWSSITGFCQARLARDCCFVHCMENSFCNSDNNTLQLLYNIEIRSEWRNQRPQWDIFITPHNIQHHTSKLFSSLRGICHFTIIKSNHSL